MIEARASAQRNSDRLAVVVLLLTAATVLGAYTVLRYGGFWGETDTATLIRPARAMREAGQLLTSGATYPNGYAFQVLLVSLSDLAGIRMQHLQLLGGPLLMVWLVFPAWLLYRYFTGSQRAALLATVFLLIQPELMFAVTRGSHEKFTRGLMLLGLYLLLRSFRARDDSPRFAAWNLAFYLCAYAIIAFNNLMATSYIVAILLALLFTWILVRRHAAPMAETVASAGLNRLLYAAGLMLILAFTFSFYAYPPARHQIQVLESVWDQLAALLLDVEAVTTNPYATITTAWIHPLVYLALSLANWLLLGASALIWLHQSRRWFVKRQQPQSFRAVLLWAFYGAFALIGALSILVDVSGAIAGNLQHRTFPSFTMLAAPLLAAWLVAADTARISRPKRLSRAVLWPLVAVLAILSTFKMTNEPLLSNKWLFYRPGEMQGLTWAEDALAERSLWTAFDERLSAARTIQEPEQPKFILDQYAVDPASRDFLISSVTLARSVRLKAPLAVEADSFITYDNGQAEIYHLRPRTPFQR